MTLSTLAVTLRDYGIEQLPDQKSFPESDGVLILDQTDNDVVIEGNKLVTIETHHVIKKLFRNIGDEATVSIYIPEGDELMEIKARTHRADGSIVELNPAEFYTITGIAGSSVIFADVKTIRFTFPAAEKDCIVEYKFRKKNHRPFVHDTWHIQNDLPTLRNQYTLSMPQIMSVTVPYRYKVYPTSMEMQPMIILGNSRYSSIYTDPVSFIWSRGDIPAFKPEEMMPPLESYRSHIRFSMSSWKGWDGIAEWYYKDFFKSQLAGSDSVSALARQLTAGCSTNEEKIKKVYDFVRQIRYVAVQLGESGLRPNTPHQVLKNNYGDCKDKSILTIALLTAAGIPSYPVLVLTADKGIFDPQFPSWNFNHMIVKAGDKDGWYWMDPTSEYSPFKTLPWVDQNIPVLVLYSEEAGRIETTPATIGKDNLSDVMLSVDVDSAGTAVYRATIRNTGEDARYFRSLFSEKSYTDVTELCKSMIINETVHADIDTIMLKNMKEIDTAFVLTMTFTVPGAAQRQGEIVYFPVNLFKIVRDLRWMVKDSRKFPIWYPYDHIVSKQSVVRFADTSMAVAPLPQDQYLKSGNLFYEASIQEKSTNVLVAREKMHVTNAMISPTEYKKLKLFYEKVKTNSERSIVLEKRKRK